MLQEQKQKSSKYLLLFKIVLISIILFSCGFILYMYFTVKFSYKSKIYYNIDKIPAKKAGLVFGASVWQKNKPSLALEDRIMSAVELYKKNKIKKIIMSGDNGVKEYNEPIVMKNYAVKHGVNPDDIILDYAGFRTYDSCYRFKAVFRQNNAILITQDFHLNRALYICNNLNVNSIGYAADKRILQDHKKNNLREFFASLLAWADINIFKPKPKFLGPKIEIF
jgi:SanA protein